MSGHFCYILNFVNPKTWHVTGKISIFAIIDL